MAAKEYLQLISDEIHTTIVATVDNEGLPITAACIGCGSCVAVCPQSCITGGEPPFMIRQEHCLHCGNCLRACPVGAVIR